MLRFLQSKEIRPIDFLLSSCANLRARGSLCVYMNKMNETESLEMETVTVQAKLFASFREQLENQASRYRAQRKSNLEEILRKALHSEKNL